MRKISLISQVTRGFAAVLFTSLMLCVPAFAQTQDTTPPVLQSFTFTPERFNSSRQVAAEISFGTLTDGSISVTTPGGTAASAGTFTVNPPSPLSLTLSNRDSFDFVNGTKGVGVGGDLYFASGEFVCNNRWQRGVASLGSLDNTPFDNISPPTTGYTFAVPAVIGYTYVALISTDTNAQYVMFRVTNLSSTSVTLDYQVYVSSNQPLGFLVQPGRDWWASPGPPATLKVLETQSDMRPLAATAVGLNVTYQWQKDGVDIPGATLPIIIFNNATTSASGIYRLNISNATGAVLSDPVQVTILPLAAPVFTSQPNPTVFIATGANGSLRYTYSGVPPTWPTDVIFYKDSRPLSIAPGMISSSWATGPSDPSSFTAALNLSNATEVTAGVYTATLTNSQGTVTSSPVTVQVGAVPAPTITSFAPTSGAPGGSISVFGTFLTGTTAVFFNGTSATFTIVSDSQVTTTVPFGATSGTISVTTPGGTAASAGAFTVSQPPVANAGPDQVVEATAPLTSVTLNGSASGDPDGDSLSFVWRDGPGNVVGTAAVVNVGLPLGTQAFTLAVNDGHGNTASDSVAVTVHDTTSPTVTVTRPNGGEKMLTGSSYTIEWTANDNVGVSYFSAFVSVNGGGTFNPVPGCTAVSGTLRSCVWSAPGPTTNAGRILVLAADATGNTGTDASNANFSIATGTGSITVTAPNTAAVDWGVGSTQQIKWSHNLGLQSYVLIELSRDAGETWETLSNSFKNTAAASGAFNWVVTGPTIEDAARIRVSGVNVAAGDDGDADFTVSAPYVVAATPATTATNLGYESARKQTWTTNLGPLDKVDVVLSTDGGATFPVTLATSVTATTKTANFTTPTLDAPTAATRIGVRWTKDGAVMGTNPVNLKVQPAYIKVTSPHLSSQVWTVGSTPALTWSSNLGASENVKVELSLDGGASYPIVLLGSTPSDGSEPVSVQTMWATTNARVRISWVRAAGVSGVSYQSFVIR